MEVVHGEGAKVQSLMRSVTPCHWAAALTAVGRREEKSRGKYPMSLSVTSHESQRQIKALML